MMEENVTNNQGINEQKSSPRTSKTEIVLKMIDYKFYLDEVIVCENSHPDEFEDEDEYVG